MNTRIRLSALTWPALLLLLANLTACSGVLTSEQAAKQYYTLMPYKGSAHSDIPDSAPSVNFSVAAVPGLDTDRILSLGTDARLQRYANARWPDHLPEVLTSVMKRSLMASGGFSSVEASERKSTSGWRLQLEVQQFYGIKSSSGETSSVLVEMAGELECGSAAKPIRLSASSGVAEDRLAAVVSAHQASLDEVTRQLLSQIQKDCQNG